MPLIDIENNRPTPRFEPLLVGRVVDEDRRPIGERDNRNLVVAGHLRDEAPQRVTHVRDGILGGGAVVEEQRDVDRLGGA